MRCNDRIDLARSTPMAGPVHRALPGAGIAYVYVAPCRDEDILKLGFSRDPLQRLQSLQPRWYAFFDTAAGWLIEADSVREARDLELQLRHPIGLHNAPSPLLVVRAAAGHTEWFRGALPALQAATDRLAELGHVVHRPLQDWLQGRLERSSDRLWHWSEQMLQAIEQARHIGAPPPELAALQRSLLDALDAYPALGLQLSERLPDAVRDWYAAQRR
jgi:hypothetical protein